MCTSMYIQEHHLHARSRYQPKGIIQPIGVKNIPAATSALTPHLRGELLPVPPPSGSVMVLIITTLGYVLQKVIPELCTD